MNELATVLPEPVRSALVIDWHYHMQFRKQVLQLDDAALPKYLLAPEIRALCELPINSHHRMLLRLLFNCGVRINEVLALTPEDLEIYEHRHLLKLRTLKQREKGSGRPKGRDVRRVPLFDRQFQTELQRYIVTNCRNRRHPIFRSARHSHFPMSAETARLWLKDIERIAKEHNIFLGTSLTPHTLRHSFAIHLLLSGVHIKRVQALLGHARLSSTEVYTKLLTIDIGEHEHITF